MVRLLSQHFEHANAFYSNIKIFNWIIQKADPVSFTLIVNKSEVKINLDYHFQEYQIKHFDRFAIYLYVKDDNHWCCFFCPGDICLVYPYCQL